MKKYTLFLFAFLVLGHFGAKAQEIDSTTWLSDTTLLVPSSDTMDIPAIERITPDRGPANTEEAENGEEDNEALELLRKMREEKEELNRKLEDVTFYPLNVESENLSSFQVLDSIADNNRFIFTGEDHRVQKFNTALEARMMQYLNTRGYKYYLMEAGSVSAWMLNRYLIEGDSAAEQILSTYYSRNFFNMFQSLRRHNDTLPEEQKIEAVGLDIERDAPLALRTLLLMLPDKHAPDSLELFVESLKILSNIHIQQAMEFSKKQNDDGGIYDFGGYEFDFGDYEEEDEDEPSYFYFNMIKTIRDLTQRFRGKEAEFQAYLGEGYPQFEHVIKELENWLVWIQFEKDQLPQSWVYREQYMEGNFRKFFKDKPEAKGFGQFGRCHITRVTKVGDCGFAFFSSLNKRLITKMPELENQVASIGIFYAGLRGDNRMNDNGNVQDLVALTEKGTASLFLDLQDYGDEMLRTKFSSIIIVKSNRYNAVDGEEDEEEWVYDPSYRSTTSVILGFNYGYRDYDLGSFQNFSGMKVNLPLSNYEFVVINKFDQTEIRNALGFFTQTTYSPSDTATQTLSGWNYQYHVGGDLFKSKNIDLTPSLGIGYMRLKYTEERQVAEQSYFGTPYYTEFYNPAFLFDGRLSLAFSMRRLILRSYAGYTLDVSNTGWKQNKKLLTEGPQTKLSGLYYGFGLGLRLGD